MSNGLTLLSSTQHPVYMHTHRLKTLFMNCPLDGEAYSLMNPKDTRSRVQVVEVLLRDRRFQEANEELHALLEAFPSDVHVQIQLANYYAHRRRFPQAQRLFETLLGTAVDKESRLGLVHVAMARGDLEPARRYLANLAQRFPEDPYIKKQQVLLWGRQGRIASAYKGLAQIKEQSLRALTKAELLNVTGQYFSAEFWFSRLISTRPRDYAAMMGLAYAYVGQHDDARAATAFQSVLHQFPDDLEARLAFVEVLMHQRRWERGREVLAGVLREEPDVLEAIYLNHQLNNTIPQAGHVRVAPSDLAWGRTLMKSSAEAIRAKQQLARFEDLNGIRVVSHSFVGKMPMSSAVLSQWTDAMIQTGRAQEGLDLLLSLQDHQASDVNRSIAIATFQVHQGQYADARATLEHVPATLEKAALYQRMKQATNAAELFAEVVRHDAAHTHAQIGAVTSLAAIGQEEKASTTLSQLFNDCPREGWSALAGLLVYTEGINRPYQTMLQTELKSRGLDDTSERYDARLRYFSLLSQLEHHAEVVNGYQILDQKHGQRPELVLQLARGLVQDHESRAMHTVQRVLDTYDRYLALKPYDVAVWTEKARFLGWQSQYAEAEKEYEAILAQYPHEEVVRLELEGKRRYWRRNDRLALRRNREVLERQPQHEEALSDLGQIHSSRYRFSDS